MNYIEWLNGAQGGKEAHGCMLQSLPSEFPEFFLSTFADALLKLRARMKGIRYFSAPMTHASGAAFRQLVREHMVDDGEPDNFAGFTQMYTAEALPHNPALWTTVQSVPAPGEELVLQLCGSSPSCFKEAARMLQDSPIAPQVIAMDINLGCPATCASSRGYGFYIAQNWPLVHQIISAVASLNAFPITCKIRPLDTPEQTANYMCLLVASGAVGITVHMRHTKRQGKHAQSVAPSYDEFGTILSLFKQKMNSILGVNVDAPTKEDIESLMPVIILNGGIRNRQEADTLLARFPIDGVMLGVGLLKNPLCLTKTFSDTVQTRNKAYWVKEATRYLDLCEELAELPVTLNSTLKVVPAASHKEIVGHVMRLLQNVSARRFNEAVNRTKTVEELREVLEKIMQG